MQGIANFIFKTVLGWKLIGNIDPQIKKCIIIIVPHTSWHDFYIGALCRSIIKLDINYVAKKELFDSAFGWYFRWMGGAPIDRSKSLNTVEQIVQIYNSKDEFRLAITPEGTRKKVEEWKTGFYHIAHKTNVPIIPVAFNYAVKEVQIGEPIYVSGNIQQELPMIKSKFKGVVGKN